MMPVGKIGSSISGNGDESSRPNIRLCFFRRDGHRDLWARVIEKIAPVSVTFEEPSVRLVMTRGRLVLLSADDCMPFSLISSTLRSVAGANTDLLVLNCERLIRLRSQRQCLLKALLRIIKCLPGVRIVSITPPVVEPEIASVANAYLPDPNFFDIACGITELDRAFKSAVLHRLQGRVGRRRLLVSVGLQTAVRGVGLLMEAYLTNENFRERFDVILSGKMGDVSHELVADFRAAGGIFETGFLTEPEMLSLLSQADVVYCVFDPSYDQSSGVFGHAMQLDKPIIVRKGSRLNQWQKMVFVRDFSADFTPEGLADALLSFEGHDRGAKICGSPYSPQSMREAWVEFLVRGKVVRLE